MRGHVKKRGRNYYVILELDPVNGSRRQKQISVRQELNLNRPAKKYEADALLKPARFTLAEYLQRWLTDYVHLNCKQKTVDFYTLLVTKHIVPEIGDVPLKQLRPAHIQGLVTKKSAGGRLDGKPGGLSKRTVQAMVTMLRQALDQAIQWEYVHRNAAIGVKTKTRSGVNPFAGTGPRHLLFSIP